MNPEDREMPEDREVHDHAEQEVPRDDRPEPMAHEPTADEPMADEPATETPDQPARMEAEHDLEHEEGAHPTAEPPNMRGETPGELDLTEYRERFDHLQAEFIEEPESAVREAQSLVKEAVDRMMSGAGHSANGTDTEHLRLEMKRYRDLIYALTDKEETPSAGFAGTSPHGGEESRPPLTPPA